MEAWFFLLLILPFLTIFLLQKNKKPNKTRKPPGPPGLPLIGNLHQFDSAKPHEYLKKLSNKYGPLMSLQLGSVPVVVISSAEMVKEALRNHDIALSGRPALVCTQKLSYNGLDVGFSPYGDYWREMRKVTVLHLLSLKKVQSFHPILEDEISKLMQRISVLGSSSQVINIRSTFAALTNSIICRIAFGKKGDIQRPDRKTAQQILHETEALLGGFFVSDYLPSLRWIDKLRGMFSRLEKNFDELDSFYQELIEEHLDPKMPESMKNNILDLLIQLKEQQSSTVELTWNHIKAMLTNLFIAATNSTAGTIIWAMTSLLRNPSTMKRLQTEIREAFGSKAFGSKIEAEELRELPYLNAVIKETLRFNIPAPLLLPRQTIERCTVAGYEIEPNTLVLINAWAIARDPKTWENPNDFKPERFLNSDVDVRGQHFELIPFGSGRRGCPGIHLALATVELVLANLLNFFDWELPSGMKIEDIDIEGMPGLTMLPKEALYLIARKRA